MVKVPLGEETSILSLAVPLAATSKATWMVRDGGGKARSLGPREGPDLALYGSK